MTLEALEAAVLQKRLEGDHPALAALRHQMADLSVKSRERTGAGFFTEFSVRPDVLPSGNAQFGDVEAEISGLENGAGFLLYVEAGLLHMLEGFTYEEPWPEGVLQFSLGYADPSRKAVLATLS